MLPMIGFPDELIIHYSYSPDHDTLLDANQIEDYHVNVRGFSPPGGYHTITEHVDGRARTVYMRPWFFQGAHTLGHNNTFGACVVGYFDTSAPKEDLLVELERVIALFDWLSIQVTGHPLRKITGHCEYSEKTCPGRMFPMNRFARSTDYFSSDKLMAFKDGNYIIKEAPVQQVSFMRKVANAWTEPGTDMMNGPFYYGKNLLGVLYDRGRMYHNGYVWRVNGTVVSPRSTLILYRDGTAAVERIQNLDLHRRLADIVLAIGGFSLSRDVRILEDVSASVPEGHIRPRTAIGFKNGLVHGITTATSLGKTLTRMEKDLGDMGLDSSNCIFLDGGGSTQCYYDNNGSPLYKRAYTSPAGWVVFER
jgi:phosphodiester glycosidase